MDEPWYYDVVAPVYDIIVPRDIKGICDSFEDIIKCYAASRQIVDLGCGTGRFAIELARRKYWVIGIDLSEPMLVAAGKNARRSHTRVKFLKADMRDFSLPRKAHIIWARGSIGDLLRPSDRRRALANIRRNLTRKGIFVFDVRDPDQHFRTHGKATVRDTRVFRQRGRTVTFRFALNLNRITRIAKVAGEVLVEDGRNTVLLKTNHALRYFTNRELRRLLTAARFELLDVMPGYHLEKNPKPRLVAVAQRR